MDNTVTRRHLLAGGAGGLALLAGCQSIIGSEVSIAVHVLNSTDENQDAALELTRSDDENYRTGEILPIESGIAEVVELSVPPGTYQMNLVIDDVVPRPEKTVDWEVTDSACATERYWAISPADTGLTLQSIEPNCDDAA